MFNFSDVVRRSTQSSGSAVAADAEKLLRQHGATAAQAAAVLASLESYGLNPVPTPNPGHWTQVKGEIERRLSVCATDRHANVAPSQPLALTPA